MRHGNGLGWLWKRGGRVSGDAWVTMTLWVNKLTSRILSGTTAGGGGGGTTSEHEGKRLLEGGHTSGELGLDLHVLSVFVLRSQVEH